MLLIDEVDRADEEFEAFLLEVLSDFQVSIPELGTIRAKQRPTVVLTSNRTRELHDALKRRCLYHWIGHPSVEREIEIVRLRVPGVPDRLAEQAARFAAQLRDLDLQKPPGLAETIDWVQALAALGQQELDVEHVQATLGSVLKYHEDLLAAPRRRARRPRRRGAASNDRADALVRHLVVFGRVLREAGLEVGPGPDQDALRGLDVIDLTRRDDVYWTLARRSSRAPRTSRPSTARGRPGSCARPSGRPSRERQPPPAEARRPGSAAAGRRERDGGEVRPGGASEREQLAARDFAAMTPDEFARARR